MLIRSALAALDFNFNVQRKSKVSADGKPMYKMKVCYKRTFYGVILFGGPSMLSPSSEDPHRRELNCITLIFKKYNCSCFVKCNVQVDRTGTKVTIVPQKEKKDYSFQTNILDLVLECLEKVVIPDPEVPQLK